MSADTVLKLAITDDTKWMLQPELKAIKDGLVYTEIFCDEYTYKGYVNKEGQREGVGITNYGK